MMVPPTSARVLSFGSIWHCVTETSPVALGAAAGAGELAGATAGIGELPDDEDLGAAVVAGEGVGAGATAGAAVVAVVEGAVDAAVVDVGVPVLEVADAA